MKTIRRYEVYYDPIPPSLQNLTDQNYLAVVRAFTNDYPVAKKPFVVIGQITTRDGREYQPVPNIKVEVKESGEQTFTDTSGSFQLPATPKGSLIVHWPDRNPEEITIEGREYHSLITYSRKDRLEKYRDKLQKRLIERMSEAALEEDRKAIQREINKLDNAINSLQRNDTDTILTKTITGRVINAFANQGIEGVFIKATDGTIAVTDEKGYYQIYLPAQTTNTEFEVTHPDFPTQHTEVDASVQKAVYLSLFKEKNRLVITGERIGQLEADSSVYQDLQDRFLYDPENNTMRLLSEAELLNDTVNKDGFYTIYDPGMLFTLDDIPIDPRTIPVDSVAFTKWDNQRVPKGYKFVVRAYTEEETPADESPLYVVNGVVQTNDKSVGAIDPDRIASIKTMKGDEARIWFGKQASGGAVLISTKDAPPRTIQGKVFSSETQQPLSGVTLSVKGRKLAVSDQSGNYHTEIPNYSFRFILSKSGYETLRPSSDGYPAWPTKLYMRPVPSSEEIASLYQKYLIREVPRTLYSVNNIALMYEESLPNLELADIQSIRVTERESMPAYLREKYDRIVSISTVDSYQYIPLSSSNVNALYVINGIPQRDRTNLSDIQPEDIASVETVRVIGNQADQFEGLPIEGRDQVIYVTTKATLTSKTIKGRIIEDRSRKGIAGVKISTTNGSTAITNNDGYYQLRLPKSTEKTIFEFTHPDYPHGEIEAKITGEKLNDILFIKPEHYQKKRDSTAQTVEVDSVDSPQIQQINSTNYPPLYIIDGVFVEDPLKNIDSNNIKNIEVVRYPESENRYGKEAIGGAVLITTKNLSASKIAKGKVTDFASGKPLEDIYVRAKGTAIGTKTNSDGEYRMKIPEFINQVEFFHNGRAEVIAAINSRGIADTEILTDRSAELKNTLFIINGEIRKDIHSYQDVDALNLNIEHEGVIDNRGLVEIPSGYRRVIRFSTKDYQLPSADQTIRGKIIDLGNRKPLAGVEVRWVKPGGKTVLAHSDERGEYQITLTKEMNTIEYSRPGYATQSITDDVIRKALPLQWVVPLWHESRTDNFAKQLLIFPNPADDEIHVKFTLEEANSVQFELRDQEGNVLHSVEYHYSDTGTKEVTIPTSRFPASVYLLQVSIDNFSATQRVILE